MDIRVEFLGLRAVLCRHAGLELGALLGAGAGGGRHRRGSERCGSVAFQGRRLPGAGRPDRGQSRRPREDVLHFQRQHKVHRLRRVRGARAGARFALGPGLQHDSLHHPEDGSIRTFSRTKRLVHRSEQPATPAIAASAWGIPPPAATAGSVRGMHVLCRLVLGVHRLPRRRLQLQPQVQWAVLRQGC